MRLQMKDLTKTYGALTALDSFSIEMDCGIYALLGVNGAGKSTLMGLLTDNVERNHGEILWEGEEISVLRGRYRKHLGYMPQRQALYEDFTPLEFLTYMAELKEIKRKDAKAQIKELLKVVNLSYVKNKKIRGFSGGMKQRVLLAQALLGDPKLLILDEPTVGLDPRERNHFRSYLKSIAPGKTILYATHVVSDIENIADCVIIMKDGRIAAKGTKEELLAGVPEKTASLEEAFLYYIGALRLQLDEKEQKEEWLSI